MHQSWGVLQNRFCIITSRVANWNSLIADVWVAEVPYPLLVLAALTGGRIGHDRGVLAVGETVAVAVFVRLVTAFEHLPVVVGP